MKYFFIDSRIDEALLNKFFQFANENPDDDWIISIWSAGGMTTIAKAVLYIINSRKDRVTLICNEVYSAAFEIFYFAECKKVLTRECKGCIHFSAADIRLMSNGKSMDGENLCIMQNWKEDKSGSVLAKKILTKDEFKDFNNGYDVYLTTKRMKQIFPQAELV